MSKKTRNPLVVVVNEGRYDVYGNDNSFRHAFLKDVIEKTGRIQDGTAPGIYHYHLERRGLKVISVLKRLGDI